MQSLISQGLAGHINPIFIGYLNCSLRTLICVHFRSFKRVRIFDVLDTFSDFKKPIHLSEITISAYSNSDEDLAIQAEIAKNI